MRFLIQRAILGNFLIMLALGFPAVALADNSWLLYISSYSLDIDDDGLDRALEESLGTNWRIADTDGDGIADGTEVILSTNPLLKDTDGDGLNDGIEIALGTNALLADTDGDTMSDGDEVAAGFDPSDPSDCPKKNCESQILKIIRYAKSE
ncbi:thrombospondin type 3 repeat-containing protein [Pseudomonadales bacterium]|nr:thrombospondin type 3 repeat-containing protein [Pseudomonadales bacterium]